jgi:haloalkane dehalogenase
LIFLSAGFSFLSLDPSKGAQMSIDRPAWVPQHLYPFESRTVEIDGNRVHYIDEGAGPTILFLHGNPTWSFLYRNVVLALRDSFRCVALDYPGFGLSAAAHDYDFTAASHADVVSRFISALDLRDVTIMGQDWGGPIGLAAATRDPQRVSGFVFGNTWAWPLNGIFHFEAFARLMGSRPIGLAILHANLFVNLMIPLGTATRLSSEVMEAYRGPFASKEARRATWDFPRELLRSKPFLEEIAADIDLVSQLPTLFTWGGGDFALRKSVELPRFQTLFRNHQTLVIDHAKHFFQEDAPLDVALAIRNWMGSRAHLSVGTTPSP